MNFSLKPGLHWLGVFFPLAIALDYYHVAAPFIFFSAALAILPVARLISRSTEAVAHYTGDTAGGLLNATFGNAPELMITLLALHAGLHGMVLASLVGGILANLLLTLGLSFFIGGVTFHSQTYNSSSSRLYSSMMLLSVLSLTVPSAFHGLLSNTTAIRHENALNIAIAILLLGTYGLYLVFMLKTHPELFTSEGQPGEADEDPQWSLRKGIVLLVAASSLAAIMSEVLVGAAEETGTSLGMSSTFVGVVLLAVIGGFAETLSAILMARKNKLDLSVSIALGSSTQIALFVAPLLVLLSLVVGPGQLNLTFSKPLIGALFLGVFMGAIVSGDGRANWFKGVQLVVFYTIIALLFYFVPVGA